MTDLPSNWSSGEILEAADLNKILAQRIDDVRPVDGTTRNLTDNGGDLGSSAYGWSAAYINNINNDLGVKTASPTFSAGGGVHISDGTQAVLRLDNTGANTFELVSAAGNNMIIYDVDGAANMVVVGNDGNVAASAGFSTDGNSAIKWKTFTGTTDNDSSTSVAHGLTATSIITVVGNIYASSETTYYILGNEATVDPYVQYDATNIIITGSNGKFWQNAYKVVVYYI